METTIKALKYHKFSLKYINDDDVKKAQRWIERCVPLADQLVEASTKMVNQSDYLRGITEDAFLETQRNDVQNTDEIRKTSKNHM